jgi:hypothetical protein
LLHHLLPCHKEIVEKNPAETGFLLYLHISAVLPTYFK